jgi:hypothetical protein
VFDQLLKGRSLPTKVDFGSMQWEEVKGGGAVGRAKKFVDVDRKTIRLLELDPSWNEEEWCKHKHVGYVISGSLRLDLAKGLPLEVRRGEGFSIPQGCAHKASCRKVTRIFVVD